MSHKPAGGPRSNKVTQQGVKTGDTRKGISPGWVGQKGQMVGNHITDDKNTGYTGEKKFDGKTGISVPLGNSVALNVKGGSPGAGRTIHKTGSQDCWGQPAQGNPPKQRGTFE
jgi:hypothetical protein